MCKPVKVSQRAARKAAAACLARQRHKSFVTSLQDTSDALKVRVGVMKQRRNDMFSACAVQMLERMAERLSESQMLQLNRWLMRSPKLAASLSAIAAKAADGQAAAVVETEPPAAVETPGEAPCERQTSQTTSQTIALDEELSKQAFVAEAMATMQPSDDEEDEDALPEHEEWMGPMLHALELQEAYGDGLSTLLQYLSASRQPSVQAWLQLKMEAERMNDAPSTWTNLSSLEEDFVLINHEHLHSSGLASFHASAVPGAVH